MYVIGASYLEGASLDLTGGTEISSVLNLTLWFHNTLIHSIVLLPTNKHLTRKINKKYNNIIKEKLTRIKRLKI
jgi:hypothetical protein